MLRKRNYDLIYAGLNFHSLLWGLAEIRQGKNVLILDSQAEHLKATSAHWGLLNYFEFLALKQKWQESVGDLSLKGIFTLNEEEIYFGSEVLRLGAISPKNNLLELKRRFYHCYPKVQPDLSHFDEIIYRLGKEAYQKIQLNLSYEPSKKERTEQPILNFLLEFAINIDKDSDLFRHCLAPMRFYYLFESGMKENTLLCLLLNLLPRYHFHEDEIAKDLRHYFLQAGGEIKKSRIDVVGKAKKRELLQVRIHSLEGMLLTKRLHFFGGTPEEGIRVGNLEKGQHQWSEICLSLEVKMLPANLKNEARVLLVDKRINSEDFGPIWMRNKGNEVFFYSYYRFRFGYNDKDIKTAFYSYLKNLFLLKFNKSLPELSTFSFCPVGDQLCFIGENYGAFVPSHFLNDPLDHFSEQLFYSGLAAGGTLGLSNLFWSHTKKGSRQTKPAEGQTAVEYLLLLVVISLIAFALMKKLNEKLIGNAGDCAQGGDSLICQIQSLMNAEGNFKYFRINQ